MTQATRRKPAPPPAQDQAAPPAEVEPDAKPWRGVLTRHDDMTVTGHLADRWGWRLSIAGKLVDEAGKTDKANGVRRFTRMDLSMRPERGDASMDKPFEVWHGHLTKGETEWTGFAENGERWIIHLTASPSRIGELTLTGSVRDVPARHRAAQLDI